MAEEEEVSEVRSNVKAEEKKSEKDACTITMRRVVARSSGIGSIKRDWMKPPSEVNNVRKPAKPRFAEQLGLMSSVGCHCLRNSFGRSSCAWG